MLPSIEGRVESHALRQAQTSDTRLGRAFSDGVANGNSSADITSNIITLKDPLEAFVARVLLAQTSDLSLDLQYYIWRDDLSSNLLLLSLCQAADRGVRVRLLLDDNGASGLDATLAALNHHKNIEVRLFNPFAQRSVKVLGYLTDFKRLNRRMHNKSFTVDNQLSIVGGRNVADEYFGVHSGILFSDLDVLASGPVVDQVSQDFDRYWNSLSAYPVETLIAPAGEKELEDLKAELSATADTAEAQRFMSAIRTSGFIDRLLNQDISPILAPVELVSDNPAKVLDASPENELVSRQLDKILGSPQKSLTLVSPYFVPGERGVVLLSDLARQGVEIKILTNSLEANDVPAVHSGYAKYRRALLEAGVQLFEMRRFGAEKAGLKGSSLSPFASSASSLHAKTFAVDSRLVFVGSFNMDPRSNQLNTEMGFLISSPQLAGMMESEFEQRVRQVAYEITLNDEGDLRWLEYDGQEILSHEHEPNTTWFKRALVSLLSLLPLEPLL